MIAVFVEHFLVRFFIIQFIDCEVHSIVVVAMIAVLNLLNANPRDRAWIVLPKLQQKFKMNFDFRQQKNYLFLVHNYYKLLFILQEIWKTTIFLMVQHSLQ